MAEIPTCPKCGHPHVERRGGRACTGHKSQRDQDDQLVPCANAPLAGQEVCRYHGGAAAQNRAKGAERVAEQAAEQALQRGLAAAYGENVPDIDPAEAMLRAVSWKYAEVLALRAKVAELDDRQRVWGTTKDTPFGSTEEAKPNIWWTMLRTAEDQLVKFAAAARAAGCDERRVHLAEQQAAIVVGTIQRILDGLYTALIAAGVPAETLQQAWAAAVAEVVPRELRAAALEGG